MRTPALSRKTRWAVPAGAVAVSAAVAVGSAIGVAQAAPHLPARTPASLLAAALSAKLPQFNGTATETVSLGVPQLPGAADPSSITSLLAGSHSLSIAYGGPGRERLALPVPMGETDLIHNGRTLWLWQASNDSVLRLQVPAGQSTPEAMPHGAKLPLTPEQAAQQALAAAGPSTAVTVGPSVLVAGQSAYQLVISPKASGSSIGRITIALDAQHPNMPLRVQVFARGATAPAIQVGFTSISFAAQAPSVFAFTPPHNAHVHTVTPSLAQPAIACPAGPFAKALPAFPPGGKLPKGASAIVGRSLASQEVIKDMGNNGGGPFNTNSSAVPAPVFPGSPMIPAAAPGKATAAQAKAYQAFRRAFLAAQKAKGIRINAVHVGAGAPAEGFATSEPVLPKPGAVAGARVILRSRALPRGVFACAVPSPLGFATGAPHVIGKGWTAVAVLPSGVLAGVGGMGSIAGAAGQSAKSVAGAPGATVSGGAALAALLASAHSVHGKWGSGRLVQTSLLSILITNNGHVLVGMVTPSVLYADASQVK